jgi:hypothetical protein
MERGGQGGRRRALARLLKGEGGVAFQGRSSRLITFYLVTEPPDDMPDLECEEVRLQIFNLEKALILYACLLRRGL